MAKDPAKRQSLEEFAREEVRRLNSEIEEVTKELEPHYAARDRIFDEVFRLRTSADPVVAEIKRIENEQLIPLRRDLKIAGDTASGYSLGRSPTDAA
jgi:hypothetical protein